jgi:hypothetical protein
MYNKTHDPTMPPLAALGALGYDMWRRRLSRPPSRAESARRLKRPPAPVARRCGIVDVPHSHVLPFSPEPVFDLFSVYEVAEAIERQRGYHRDRHPW